MAHFRPLAEDGARPSWTSRWQGRDWLVGDACTIADIGCWGRMVFMAEGGMDIAALAQRRSLVAAAAAMPGFALPYDLIPKKDQEMVPA